MKDKRYLVIAHNYWPAIGGAEKLLQSIAENLNKNNQNVSVLTSNAKNCLMYFSVAPEVVGNKAEIINNISVEREDIRNIFQRGSKILWTLFVKNSRIKNDLEPLLIGPHFAKSVLKYIFSKDKYTHILCGPFPTSVPFYGYLFKLLSPKAKFILDPSLHVDDPMHTGRILRFIARRSDAILVRTGEETNLLMSWGICNDKIIEIGVGVDDTLLLNNKMDKKIKDMPFSDYVLFMGQEVSHKNIIVLIDAMERIWHSGINIGLVIAGARTDYSREIDERINRMAMDDRRKIYRLNNFDEDIKKDLLDNCRLMVLPSSRESFGIVFVEAWARKKPVIGANVAGVRFLIENNVDGLLFEENNPIDLMEKISLLLNNSDFSKKMGEDGYEKVCDKYRWDSIINKILAIK